MNRAPSVICVYPTHRYLEAALPPVGTSKNMPPNPSGIARGRARSASAASNVLTPPPRRHWPVRWSWMLGSGPSFEHDYEHVLERIDRAFEAGRKTLHAA